MTVFIIISTAFLSVGPYTIDALLQVLYFESKLFFLIIEFSLLAFIKAKLHLRKR